MREEELRIRLWITVGDDDSSLTLGQTFSVPDIRERSLPCCGARLHQPWIKCWDEILLQLAVSVRVPTEPNSIHGYVREPINVKKYNLLSVLKKLNDIINSCRQLMYWSKVMAQPKCNISMNNGYVGDTNPINIKIRIYLKRETFTHLMSKYLTPQISWFKSVSSCVIAIIRYSSSLAKSVS